MSWRVGENAPHKQTGSSQDVADHRAGARRLDVETQMPQLLLGLHCALARREELLADTRRRRCHGPERRSQAPAVSSSSRNEI